MTTREPFTLGNDYANVELSVDHDGLGPRLRIRSLRDGATTSLDPMKLLLCCSIDEDLWSTIAAIASDHASRQPLLEPHNDHTHTGAPS